MFSNVLDDTQWLLSTHLKGVPLSTKYAGFKSFVLQGNEDCPYAVNLYAVENPVLTDDYFRVRFVQDGTVYCDACEYEGATDKPYGGLAHLA